MSAVEPDEIPRQVRVAATVVAGEALALLVAVAVLVAKTLTGHPNSVGRALLGAGLALLAALLLAAAARGLLRRSAAARTPVVVLQLLALPIGYSLAFQAGRPAYGAPIVLAAILALYLLFTPPARAALDRDR